MKQLFTGQSEDKTQHPQHGVEETSSVDEMQPALENNGTHADAAEQATLDEIPEEGQADEDDAFATSPLKRHPVIFDLILVILIIAGIVVIAYPTISQWWNARQQASVVADYESIEQNYGDAERNEMLEKARRYNADLAAGRLDWRLESDYARYMSILSFDGTPAMCTLGLPKLGLVLPVYHGVDDDTLQVAVGHEPGTSVPVGGVDTHAVMTAHRGLPTAELFTNLPEMNVGDIFYIHVLGDDLYYEIYEIDVIAPDNVESLEIQPGRDLATLVTCTPYGVNTHRLLVKGERVDGPPGMSGDATKIPWWLVAICLAIVPLVVLAITSLVRSFYLKRNKAKQDAGDKEIQDNESLEPQIQESG